MKLSLLAALVLLLINLVYAQTWYDIDGDRLAMPLKKGLPRGPPRFGKRGTLQPPSQTMPDYPYVLHLPYLPRVFLPPSIRPVMLLDSGGGVRTPPFLLLLGVGNGLPLGTEPYMRTYGGRRDKS
ncbi:hypothetical protein AAVH_00764 [Aphelenchoides avenae]|nr:hypothetical protein AAVH_00764 [Aphelenchus avenae]